MDLSNLKEHAQSNRILVTSEVWLGYHRLVCLQFLVSDIYWVVTMEAHVNVLVILLEESQNWMLLFYLRFSMSQVINA